MEIPISNILLLCLIFLLIGGVIMILLQYLIFIKFSNLPDESEEQKRMNAKYTLPVNIKQTARNLKAPPNPVNSCENHQESLQGASALISLNFVMQFLFHEFKNSNRVRKWFYRKLSIELDELITKTTTGKLLDKLTIKELELGDQFPDIKSLSVHNVELDEREQRIENLGPAAGHQTTATVFCSAHRSVLFPGIIRNDAILEDLEKYDELCDMTSATTKTEPEPEATTAETVAKHLAVKPSLSRYAAESGLTGQTPTNSPKKSNLIAKAIKKTMSRESSDKDKDKDKEKEREREKDKDKDKDKNKTDDSSTDRGTDEPVNYFYQHSTIDCAFSPLIHMDDVCSFQLDANSRFLNVCVFGKCAGESVLLGYNNVQIGQILVECSETSLNQCLRQIALNPASLQAGKMHDLANQSGFNPKLCFGDILFGFAWMGNPNVTVGDPPTTKSGSKSHSPARTQFERGQDEPPSETVSLKSSSTLADSAISSSGSNSAAPRAHSFVRTHFHRATQCDFCGKKIWLKDAMQCQECSMCCHKKCIAKCHNATVCGPVDCSGSLPQPSTSAGTPSGVTKPEFTITQAENLELYEPKTGSVQVEEAATTTGEQAQVQVQAGLDVHRSSLTGMLAQGIKRQASNLDIPGIVSSLTGSGQQMNSKSLPPSPQHTPSRKSSIVEEVAAPLVHQNPFERVTQHLEALPAECTVLSFEQVIIITEPIIRHNRNEDLMNLAKSSSKHLYASAPPDERVAKINELLTKLKIALDAETEGYTMMNDAEKATESSPYKSSTISVENRSDERVQALSIIMLYLCTGLQHAQGVVLQ
ncbi:GL15849 [Drosophila persimilis]|uniref:GL15849 n=1 Tax=Drosophila persimilis TaxID=7234 RepID=B4H0Y3_DROPE|nr:GL15849 [Drosophila persimilis]